MKLLYIARDYIEADIIKDQLSDHNIECYLKGSNLQTIIGEVPIDSMFIKIFINEDDHVKADAFIKE